ncbi:MAG: hypothetical protein IT436_15010 [Phycisphaerales bacterium]|nr:hypothetical protein [Phycisphaerales bacterium]
MKTSPTEHDGRRALQDHILERAMAARAAHGPTMDDGAMRRVLADRSAVRYPAEVRFDAGLLQPGEFAHAVQLGEHPRQGFCLALHPALEDRPGLRPLAIAYHIAPINYGDIAGPEECELFGATLLGIHVDDYYRALCELADMLWVG